MKQPSGNGRRRSRRRSFWPLPRAPKNTTESFTFGDADVIGPVHIRGDVAQVHARYSCDVGTHIWVSVKQNDSATVDPDVSAEGAGFGGAATAWWQSHRGTFTCDGKRHVAWFTVDTVEAGSRGELAARAGAGSSSASRPTKTSTRSRWSGRGW